MPAVSADTVCGPSTASQNTATATLTTAATAKRSRDGRISTPTASTAWTSAANTPRVASVPFKWPEAMANSSTAEPLRVTKSRMGNGRPELPVPPALPAPSVGAPAKTASFGSVISPPTSLPLAHGGHSH